MGKLGGLVRSAARLVKTRLPLPMGRAGSPARHAAAVRAAAPAFVLEPLEGRVLMAVGPTDNEQFMLELINRFRTNPAPELDELTDSLVPIHSADANINSALQFFQVDGITLAAQWAGLAAAPPLAWNDSLKTSATTHTQLMITNNVQSHQIGNEPDLTGRTQAAGYTSPTALGECIYAYADTVLYGHAGLVIDWGDDSIGAVNGIQNPPGHRNILIDATYTEIGIAIIPNTVVNQSTVGPLVITQHVGDRSTLTEPYLLGVVYDDADDNDFYGIGEGLAGVTVTATGVNGTPGQETATSMTAGGYQMFLAPGEYQVTFSGGGLVSDIVYDNVVISGVNFKLDAPVDPPSAANMAPTVGVLYPAANNVPQGANLTLKASDVVDRDGVINRVEFYYDANRNGLFDSGSDQLLGLGEADPVGWKWTGPTAGLPSGASTFFVRGRDDADVWSAARSAVATLAAAPLIGVTGNSVVIVPGSATPSVANGTDLGSADTYSGSVVQTFAIRNLGAQTLSLTNSPAVQISGAAAADFSVVAQPATSIVAAGSLNFQIRFDPSRIGVRQATVTIASNDATQPAFTFTIRGWGDTAFYDETTYLRLNPDVAAAVGTGKAYAAGKTHFLLFGYKERRKFSLIYDESFYLANNTDVAAVTGPGKFWASGLDHFLAFGLVEARPFGPFYNEAYYLAMNPDVAAGVGVGKFWRRGILHFLANGQFENRRYTPWYHESLYRLRNPDVAAAVGVGKAFRTGFEHYLSYGQYEGRKAGLFYDEQTYRSANPDVAAAVGPGKAYRSAIQHFLLFGQFEEGRVFSPWFDRAFYLAQNPGVATLIGAGKPYRTAFAHFVLVGQFDGLRFTQNFNEAAYLARYPDVAGGVGAGKFFRFGFEHFVFFGQAEGRTGT